MRKTTESDYAHLSIESEKELLEQRYISLEAIFDEIKNRSTGSDQEKNLISIIEELFKQVRSWPNISAIQQTLIGLMTEDEIEVEFNVRLIKSKGLLSEELFAYYNENKATPKLEKKKELLERLIRDTQWYSKILDLEKTYVSKTRVRTGVLFALSIVLFFAVDQLPWIAEFLGIEKGDKGDAILTAVTSGCLGTCFSMLIGLKGRLNLISLSDLRVLHRFDYILSRALIGFVSGLILFYFFDSEIVRAPLFPDFNHEGKATEFLNHENLALLVVWCFISGFSEKFVPDLLFKTGQSLSGEVTVKNDELSGGNAMP